MKIGIVTFHGTWNCGAVLQCVALKNKLEQMGHEVVVINYRPKYQSNRYKKYPNPFRKAFHILKNSNLNPMKRVEKSLRSFVRSILNYNPKSGRLKQKADFDKFSNQYFNQTRLYGSIKELQKNPPYCDVYISGSDQLWNPKLTNGELDEAYFCNFGESSAKRIGYAISTCELNVSQHKERLETLLGKFDRISLREEENRHELQELFQKKIDRCIDPTLLLTAKDYKKFEMPCVDITIPYILVYAFDFHSSSDLLFNTVRQLMDKHGLRVKVINGPHRWPFEVEFYDPLDGISPGEFLQYIKNAQVVVTNSFHATTFSIIYKRPFYALTAPGRGSRVIELLNNSGLQDRLVNDKDVVLSFDKDIDYSSVEEKIRLLSESSEEYLREAINLN